jgi:hypothetical protein
MKRVRCVIYTLHVLRVLCVPYERVCGAGARERENKNKSLGFGFGD